MSTDIYQGIPKDALEYFESQIVDVTWAKSKLLNWFEMMGLKRNVGPGVETFNYSKWEKMPPLKITARLQDMPRVGPNFEFADQKLMQLGVILELPKANVDSFMNPQAGLYGGGDLMSQSMVQLLDKLVEQVDQFLYYGDALKNGLVGDLKLAKGSFFGILNGGTAFGGGDGENNNMADAGDFISTVANGVDLLKEAGFESEVGYFMFSDNTTVKKAKTGTHQINTLDFITEYSRVLNTDIEIIDWIDSINAKDASGNSRIAITYPFTSKGKPAYELITSYDFTVIPLYNGGLDAAFNYLIAVVWSGAIVEYFSDAIYRTGNLVFV